MATKPFVFILMPFDPKFKDVHYGITSACNDAGAYCERVDEQMFDEGMMDRIYNQIQKADIIVADMTGRNPNVFYEVGYAHAIGKRVILLTASSDDIPFDLKHHKHIVYEGQIHQLHRELLQRLKWAISTPQESLIDKINRLELDLSTSQSQLTASISPFDSLEETDFSFIHNKLNQSVAVIYKTGKKDGNFDKYDTQIICIGNFLEIIIRSIDVGIESYPNNYRDYLLQIALTLSIVEENEESAPIDVELRHIDNQQVDNGIDIAPWEIDLKRYGLIISIEKQSILGRYSSNIFTEKMHRFVYWLEFNNLKPSSVKLEFLKTIEIKDNGK